MKLEEMKTIDLNNNLKSTLKLSTPFKSITVNKETVRTALTVNFEAPQPPSFTWFDNNGQIIYANKTLLLNRVKYYVREDSESVTLEITFVDYHCFGNFTLMAELWGLSESISVEMIVEGKETK
jgi:hypothetical protein